MRALYLKEKLVFEERSIPAPLPKDDEVLIKDQIFITGSMGKSAVLSLKNL
jgi:hypothetical protein